jgi:hypothetical protein
VSKYWLYSIEERTPLYNCLCRDCRQPATASYLVSSLALLLICKEGKCCCVLNYGARNFHLFAEQLLNSIPQMPRTYRRCGVSGDFRIGFLRMRRFSVRRPSCAHIILRAASRGHRSLIASNVTRWLLSETHVWIGNRQARKFLLQQRHIKERDKVFCRPD